jgi:hypothetical protein
MKKGTTLIIALALALVTNAQTQLMWQQIYGGPSIEKGYGVRSCLDQGYIAAGTTSSSGPTDGYVVRTDSIGLVIWAKFYGGVNIDVIRSVEILPDSGFIMAGYTNSFGNGGYDGWLMRLDKNGDTLWNKYTGGNDWDFFYDVDYTLDSGFICIGTTYTYGAGNEDLYLVKYDKNGDTLWTRTYGGARRDEGYSVVQTEDTLYGICGLTCSYNDTLGDGWIMYLQQNGDTVWTETAGYPNAEDAAYGIAYDSIVNTFFYCGYFTSAGDKGAYWKGLNYAKSTWMNYIANGSDDEIYYSMISKHGLSAYACAGSNFTSGSGLPDMMIFTGGSAWNTTSHGTLEEDEAFDIDFAHDGGYILCGYTEGYNSLIPNLYLVKTDSVGLSTMTVGLEEKPISQPEEGHLQLFPNPANDLLRCNIILAHPVDAGIVIYNSVGQIVFSESVLKSDFNSENNTIVTIDVSNLASGVYSCAVVGSDVPAISKRIIIAR